MPEVLIHESLPVIGIVRLATSGNTAPTTEEEKKDVYEWTRPWASGFGRSALFESTASLANVVRATTYYRRGSLACSGIVLEYKNGGQRAVGECRVGHQDTNTQITPRYLCTRPIYNEDPEPSYQMEFFTQERHSHMGSDWNCHEMEQGAHLKLVNLLDETTYEIQAPPAWAAESDIED